MKSLRTIIVLTVVGVMLAAPMALAQPTIGVYFGPDKDSTAQVQPFSHFKIWITLSNIENNVNAVEWKLNLPPQVIVIEAGLYPGSIDFGNPSDGVAIGLGECVPVFATLMEELVVAEMTVMAVGEFAGANVTITEFTGTPQDPATAPRYSDCQGGLTDLTPSDGVLASSVAVEAASWSAVKSLFD